MADTDIARAFYDLIEMGDIESLEDLLSPELQFHVSALPQPLNRRQTIIITRALVRAFPDIKLAPVIDGTQKPLVTQVTVTGTQTRDFDLAGFGLGIIEATGRRIAVPTQTLHFDIREARIHTIKATPAAGTGLAGILTQLGQPLNPII